MYSRQNRIAAANGQARLDNMEDPAYADQGCDDDDEVVVDEEPDYEAMIESKADRDLEKTLAMEWGGVDR